MPMLAKWLSGLSVSVLSGLNGLSGLSGLYLYLYVG